MAPGVVADHVAIGQDPPIDLLAVGADLLADLKEGRLDVLSFQQGQEIGSVVPGTVVECQSHDTTVARPVVDKRRSTWDATDEPRRVQPH